MSYKCDYCGEEFKEERPTKNGMKYCGNCREGKRSNIRIKIDVDMSELNELGYKLDSLVEKTKLIKNIEFNITEVFALQEKLKTLNYEKHLIEQEINNVDNKIKSIIGE